METRISFLAQIFGSGFAQPLHGGEDVENGEDGDNSEDGEDGEDGEDSEDGHQCFLPHYFQQDFWLAAVQGPGPAISIWD